MRHLLPAITLLALAACSGKPDSGGTGGTSGGTAGGDGGATFDFEGWVEPRSSWDGKACPPGSTLQSTPELSESSCLPNGPWARWYPESQQKSEEGSRVNNLFEGEYRAWHQGGQPRAFGLYAAGSRDGLWRTWFPSGAVGSQGSYRAGLLSGAWVYRFANGQLESSGSYNDAGREDGLWERYASDGQPVEKVTYASGTLSGPAERFHPSGARREQGSYQGGLQEGTWTTWHANGQKESEGSYHRGLKEGSWTTWNPDGSSDTESTWTAGYAEGTFTRWYYGDGFPAYDRGPMVHSLADGLWQAHTADGVHLLREVTFDRGLAEGAAHGFWPNDQPAFEGTYHLGSQCGPWQAWFQSGQASYQGAYVCQWQAAGNLTSLHDGPWTTWYESGQKRSEGTYQGGIKIGAWSEWSEDGQLTVTRYDNWGNPQ